MWNGHSRVRGIFPLPPLKSVEVPARISRRASQRLCRRRHWTDWANDGISALNSLSGHRPLTQPGAKNQLQELVLDRVATSSAQFCQKPPESLSNEAALRELLASAHLYDSASAVVGFRPDAVARPAVEQPVPITSCLDEEAATLLRALPSQMRPSVDCAAEGPPVKLYMDPALCRSRRLYQQFLGELRARRMVRWHRTDVAGESNVGCFFGVTRDGRQRVIRHPSGQSAVGPPTSHSFEFSGLNWLLRVYGGAFVFRHCIFGVCFLSFGVAGRLAAGVPFAAYPGSLRGHSV